MSLIARSLREWRSYVEKIACIAERLLGETVEVYITGGAAEGRLTLLSDIDIVVALDHEPSYDEAVALREKIMREAEEHGIPPYAPIELHIVGKERLARYKRAEKIECSARRHAAPDPGTPLIQAGKTPLAAPEQ